MGKSHISLNPSLVEKNALGKSCREYQNLFNAKYMFLKIVPFTGLIQEIRQRDYYDVIIRNWKIDHRILYLLKTRGVGVVEPVYEQNSQCLCFQSLVLNSKRPYEHLYSWQVWK